MNVSIYEFIMLICFGASWPMAILKTYTSKSVKGKSLVFSTLIILGYCAGIAHKISCGKWDWVGYLYIVNIAMVLVDLLLVIKYRFYSKQ